MTYAPARGRKRNVPSPFEIVQGAREDGGFKRGYVSAPVDSRVPLDALSDLTNAELDQDNLPRPRPSLIRYGGAMVGECIGIDTFIKTVLGLPERWEVSMQAILFDEVQTLAITGTPTGGTFTLTYDGQTTAAIAYNASAATVQTALEALSNIAPGDVACTGGTLPGTAVVVTFGGSLADTNVPLMTTNSGSLTGGTSPTASVVETTSGGLKGRVYVRKDGTAWQEITGDYGYDPEARASFCQSNNRIYITNGVNRLSFYDIESGDIEVYEGISAPGTPTVTPANLTGSNYTYYYRVSAVNNVGETTATAAAAQAVSKQRNNWNGTTETITVSWSAVTDADRYVIYLGDQAGKEYFLATVTGTTYLDNGSATPNPFRRPAEGNSTEAPILRALVNRNGQLFGVGDIEHPSYLWFDGGAGDSGNFFGGYVAIDHGGSSVPVAVRSFRDGKGNPAATVLTKGAAGAGKVFHAVLGFQTVGDETFTVPEVYEANGQAGTYSANGVIQANDSLFYPTGTAFRTTGSAPNVANILSSKGISRDILPDVRGLNLMAMDGCVGIEYEDKLYWALPYASEENSEIWIYDLSQQLPKWILRWKVPARFMWLYEDNAGKTHFCVLVDNKTLEFTRNVFTTDDGLAFRTRVASGGIVWDKSAMTMASVAEQRFKLLYPRGDIHINSYGEGEDGPTGTLGGEGFQVFIPQTGWGQFIWGIASWGGDVGALTFDAPKMKTILIEPDEDLNEASWEIVTEQPGCDYTLSTALTRGTVIEGSYIGD